MRARLTIAAVACATLAATAAVTLRRSDDRADGAAGDDGAAAPSPSGAFDTLTVTKNGASTTLRRQGDSFWVTAPVAYAAEPAGAAAAFEAIEKIDPSAIVTRRPVRYADLQVEVAAAGAADAGAGASRGIAVRASEGQRPRADLVVGKTVGNGTMVRVRTGRAADPVWQVNGDLHAIFDKGPSEWRDRSVTTFAVDEAREIAVATHDGAQIVLRQTEAADAGAGHGAGARAGARGWTVVQATEEIGALDEQVPAEIVTVLSALKAGDFADTATLRSAGLEPPAVTVTVTLRGGEKDTLLIGGASGPEDYFAKTTDSAQIFVIKRFNIDRLNRRPIQFRQKVLCDLPDGEIDEITVRHGVDSYTLIKSGAIWRATAPRGLTVDPDKVAAFASIFRGWRAPRIAEGAPPGAVDAPSVVITGRSKKGSCVVAAVAGPGAEDVYLAKAPPAREIFALPKWMIDRIAVKLDQIRAR